MLDPEGNEFCLIPAGQFDVDGQGRATCRARGRLGLSSGTLKRAAPPYPRPESNQRTRFRKPLLYPLSYGGPSVL